MNAPFPSSSDDASDRRLAELERRLARLEAHLGVAPEPASETASADLVAVAAAPVSPASTPAGEDLEFQVGQNWFARIGIGVLAIGAAFTLSMPFPSLPAVVPALMGYALATGFLLAARNGRGTFAPLAGELRGVAMALFFFATLRLFFFSPKPVLDTHSAVGGFVLALAFAANVTVGWRRRDPWLLGLGLLTGCAAVLAVGSAGFVLTGLVLLALLSVGFSVRGGWPAIWLAAIPVLPLTALAWALNDPFLGHPFLWVPIPAAAPYLTLAVTVILATGPLWRRPDAENENIANAGALVNCAMGLSLFVVLTLLAPMTGFVPAQLAAALGFFLLAVVFRVRGAGEVPPFLYAMTGNLALSLAIFRASGVPAVFVWLSVQSILVVAAAVWFRSRFIVVANFLIFAFIVLAYAVLAESETGISIGFGLVALASARILHWQKDRLELKTELMRNAYLFGAFVVFPYALYHLVPVRQVSLVWVGLALFYYLMNLVVRSPKFRWMGHATLLLTTVYLLIVGTRQFEPVYRVLSFLVLGTVLVAVSLIFSRLRRPQSAIKA